MSGKRILTGISILLTAAALAACTGNQLRPDGSAAGAGAGKTGRPQHSGDGFAVVGADATASQLLSAINRRLARGPDAGEETLLLADRLKKMAPDRPEALVASAMARRRLVGPSAARTDLEAALIMDPDNETALLLAGDLAVEEGDLTRADSLYSMVYKAAGSVEAGNRLAYLRIQGGYLESAREILAGALEKSPGSTVTRNNLAVVLDRMGETSAALRLLDGVGEGSEGVLLRSKALMELKEGFTDRAAADLESAAGAGEGLDLLLIAGMLDLQRGKLVAAEDRFRRAVQSHPESAPTYLNLGRTLRRQGRFTMAEQVYVSGIENTGHPDLYLNLGILQEIYRGDPAGALANYRKYISLGGAAASRVQGWVAYLSALVPDTPAEEPSQKGEQP